MAALLPGSKKIVLVYDKGRYSFKNVSQSADSDAMYNLALALNAFQEEKPPKKIISVVAKSLLK